MSGEIENLVMDVANIVHANDDNDNPDPGAFYVTMSDEQRAEKGWPVTFEEMREFIMENGNVEI